MNWFLRISIILWFAGCSSVLEDPIDSSVYGYDYYPLEVGKYRIYQIDSLQFDVGQGNIPIRDSSTFFIREEVVERFNTLAGEEAFRIERLRSESLEGPWINLDVLTQSRSVNQGYYTENNIRLINLVFPVKSGVKWDGDAFVKEGLIVFVRGESLEMYKGWDFEVLSADVPESIGGQDYDEVATIRQADTENIIEKRFSIEKYAKGVGLVYRERQIVDSFCKYIGVNDQCSGKDWIDIAGRGFFTKEILVDSN